MKIYIWDEYIEASICCQKLFIDEVMGVSSFIWSKNQRTRVWGFIEICTITYYFFKWVL